MSLQQALEVASRLNQDRHAILADLGDALLAGFTATNETAYLDDAIAAQRQALELLPADHTDRSAVLSNLGAALLRRYERFADADDLAAAMRYLDDAREAGGGRRDMIRANLGSALLRRHQLTGSPADLTAALEHLTAAAEEAPAGSAQQMSARSALAQALSAAGQLRPARDLLSGVVLNREAAFGEVAAARRAVLGPDHPDTRASQAAFEAAAPR